MSNVFNRGGIINERKINIKGCRKQLLDTYNKKLWDYVNSASCNNCTKLLVPRNGRKKLNIYN